MCKEVTEYLDYLMEFQKLFSPPSLEEIRVKATRYHLIIRLDFMINRSTLCMCNLMYDLIWSWEKVAACVLEAWESAKILLNHKVKSADWKEHLVPVWTTEYFWPTWRPGTIVWRKTHRLLRLSREMWLLLMGTSQNRTGICCLKIEMTNFFYSCKSGFVTSTINGGIHPGGNRPSDLALTRQTLS